MKNIEFLVYVAKEIKKRDKHEWGLFKERQ